MKRKILIIIVITLPFFCHGQQTTPSQSPADFITRFSFRQFNGGIILLQARLNDIPDTLNFILDTGSGGISLDSSTCVEFNIKGTPSDTTINGMGGIRKVDFVFDQTLHFPGLTIKGLDFHINNYDLLSSVYGEKIDGIIGYGFFSRYIVKVDYDSMFIEVYSPGKITYPTQGTLLHPVFTTIPIQPLSVKDAVKIDYNFYFDMGAGLCFLMSEDFLEHNHILLPRRKPLVTDGEGMGGRLQMRLTVVKLVQIGPFKFRNVPTYLYKDEYNVTSYPYIGGLIGNDLLRRFNLIINYPAREIHLLPNGHFADAFDYSYTGLSIYYIDGKILVDDIIPRSPAEEAGLKKGDIIISVDTNISNNIQQYKALLLSSKRKIGIVVNRQGELFELVIRPIVIS